MLTGTVTLNKSPPVIVFLLKISSSLFAVAFRKKSRYMSKPNSLILVFLAFVHF